METFPVGGGEREGGGGGDGEGEESDGAADLRAKFRELLNEAEEAVAKGGGGEGDTVENPLFCAAFLWMLEKFFALMLQLRARNKNFSVPKEEEWLAIHSLVQIMPDGEAAGSGEMKEQKYENQRRKKIIKDKTLELPQAAGTGLQNAVLISTNTFEIHSLVSTDTFKIHSREGSEFRLGSELNGVLVKIVHPPRSDPVTGWWSVTIEKEVKKQGRVSKEARVLSLDPSNLKRLLRFYVHQGEVYPALMGFLMSFLGNQPKYLDVVQLLQYVKGQVERNYRNIGYVLVEDFFLALDLCCWIYGVYDCTTTSPRPQGFPSPAWDGAQGSDKHKKMKEVLSNLKLAGAIFTGISKKRLEELFEKHDVPFAMAYPDPTTSSREEMTPGVNAYPHPQPGPAAHEAGAAPAAIHNKETLSGHGGASGTSAVSAAAGQSYAPAMMSVETGEQDLEDRTIAEQHQRIAALERELDTQRKKLRNQMSMMSPVPKDLRSLESR